MFRRCLAFILALGLLLSAMCLAEEPGEADLYSPEFYEGEAVPPEIEISEAAEFQPMEAAAPQGEAPGAYAVAAPELVPMSTAQTVALTGKKASAQMNVGETLQIVLGEGETGTFASKKAKYAMVDGSGLVTALAKGKATIEFKPDGGKKRTLNITIVDPYEPMGVGIAQGKAAAINVGDVLQLGAVLTPETARTALTWSSNKAKVATVDGSGLVTALAEGKAKITVRTANRKKATITVTVSDPYKPSGVSIAQGGSIMLSTGESAQLTAGLIPEGAISTLTWTSSKPKVATVDANGLVTAVGKGKATITVKTANGKKAKCAVTVNKASAPVAPDTPGTPDTPVTPVTPVTPDAPTELIDYLRTRDQTYALAGKLKLEQWEIPAGAPVIAVYDNDEVFIEIENSHDYWLTVYATSNGRYSLDGVTTTMSVDQAAATLQSRGWAYSFSQPVYDEDGKVQQGTGYYYEKNVSADERADTFVLITPDGVSLASITVAIEE